MTHPHTAEPAASLQTGAFILAAIAAIASVCYIATYYFGFDGQSDREVTASSWVTGFNFVIALALVGLAVTLPRALPTWPTLPLLLASAALAFTGATMLAFGTMGAIFADSVPDAVWDDVPGEHSVRFFLLFAPKMATGLVGFVALAAVQMQRRTVTIRHASLLAIAGLAMAVPPPPPGALLASVAALWSLQIARRSATTRPTPAMSEAR
jgi:hypothetical protein